MAKRRMLSPQITESDAFLEMPLSSQALYMHLVINADDDGFLNNPKMIQRMIGASEDDLKILISKRFLIVFESGVIVVKHFKLQNAIRKDRYTQTVYQEELRTLITKEDGSYTEAEKTLATKWQPNGNQMATSGCHSLVKSSLGQDRLGKDSIDQSSLEGKPASVSDMLTDAEWDELEKKVSDVIGLIDLCDEKTDPTTIKKPMSYLLGIARNEGYLR